MARSDFAWINFDEEFNSSNQVATRTVVIDGPHIGTVYLRIQHFDEEIGNHRISINVKGLPIFDMPAQKKIDLLWLIWMYRIPAVFMRQGQNKITIQRVSTERFGVANVAIH